MAQTWLHRSVGMAVSRTLLKCGLAAVLGIQADRSSRPSCIYGHDSRRREHANLDSSHPKKLPARFVRANVLTKRIGIGELPRYSSATFLFDTLRATIDMFAAEHRPYQSSLSLPLLRSTPGDGMPSPP